MNADEVRVIVTEQMMQHTLLSEAGRKQIDDLLEFKMNVLEFLNYQAH